jgi:hypothetical protein
MLGSKLYTKASAMPDGSRFLLPSLKKFDTNFLPVIAEASIQPLVADLK